MAVVGKGRDCPDVLRFRAFEVGQSIARTGAVLLNGGLGGVMEGAAAGAVAMGGLVVAVIPNDERGNGWAQLALRTGLSHTTRNIVMGSACDALLALDGAAGTAQEIAVASERKVPMAQVGTDAWDLDTLEPREVVPWILALQTPSREAVRSGGDAPLSSAAEEIQRRPSA